MAWTFSAHLAQGRQETPHFKAVRDEFRINPGRAYACGEREKGLRRRDEHRHAPFIVSYGFEDYERLTAKIGVPQLISRAPAELSARVANALDLAA